MWCSNPRAVHSSSPLSPLAPQPPTGLCTLGRSHPSPHGCAVLCVWEQTPPHSDSHPLESPGALKYHLPCSLTAGVRPPEAPHGETGRREAGVHGCGGPWAAWVGFGGLRVRPRPNSPCGSGFQQIRRLRNQEPPGRTCAGCGQSAELEETWWPQRQQMGGGRGEAGAGAGPEGRRPGGRGHLTRARSLVTPREAAARP